MAFIKLTFDDGTKGRFRVDAIAAYFTEDDITNVVMFGTALEDAWLVKETPEEIDELIAAAEVEVVERV